MPVPRTIEWVGGLDGCVRLIDQTLLPGELKFLECRDVETMWEAIRNLRVRGAPAIGIAAAMGLVLGIRDVDDTEEALLHKQLATQSEYLAGARPTAVNLVWALKRMERAAGRLRGQGSAAIKAALLEEATRIRDEDAAACRAIGAHGVQFIPEGGGVLTHCNAGSLATAEYGTAVAPMYVAKEQGRHFTVYSDETRPLLQGSRLTAWELGRAGIEVVTICDSMAAQVMKEGKIDCVITGADRIAANGDAANKIGTYGLAVLARAHDIPFYVAAPVSTIDPDCPTGEQIPIEQRGADEVRSLLGTPTAPPDVQIYNPAFDVTPARYITAIITDRGVISPVNGDAVRQVLTSTW